MSGVADCPCCSYQVMVSDVAVPELCDDCEDAGCNCNGADPRCDVGLEEWAEYRTD
jgi:hypothetical protein